MMKVVIKGYYGFGNLGDDILMITSNAIIHRVFPGARAYICTDSQNAGYISLLCENMTIISSLEDLKADWILHGGGGVYFDFEDGTFMYRILNSFIRTLGFNNYRKAYAFYRNVTSKPGVRASYQAGLGIGVGSFTSSSRKFYASILSLSNFDILFVRDKESLRLLAPYRFKYPTRLSTDLAFLSDAWKPEFSHYEKNSKQIGFVLRDWKYDNHDHLYKVIHAANTLKASGYTIVFYSFDQKNDCILIREVVNEFALIVWDPQTGTLEQFLQSFQSNAFIVSSRAHGAIVGACLGIPGVCIGIEPKLFAVAEMLSNSYGIFKPPFRVDELVKEVESRFGQLDTLNEKVRSDALDNQLRLMESLDLFQSFVQTNPKI